MGLHGATLGNTQDIRRILQRVAREEIPLLLRCGIHQAKAWVREEFEDRLVCEAEGRELESLGLQVGEPVQVEFLDRGRQYQAVATVQRVELRDPVTCLLAPPRTLTCLNPDAYLDLSPERPPRATSVTVSHDLRDGQAVGLAEEGLEVTWGQGRREDFRLGLPTQVSIELTRGQVPVLDAVPRYFTDDTVGLQIQGAKEVGHLEAYQKWVRDRLHELRERERLDFRREGFTVNREALKARRAVPQGLRMLGEHAPHILVLGEDEALAVHLAQALGRKFGIGYLDWIMGPLLPQVARPGIEAPWGGFRMLLVHQRQRLTSGYELIRQVVQQEACPLPVLMVGSDEDVTLKRNRAIAAGAVDYLAVEPFHVLAVMRTMEDTLKLFG